MGTIHLSEIHDREIQDRRRSTIYVFAMVAAIAAVIASIAYTYLK